MVLIIPSNAELSYVVITSSTAVVRKATAAGQDVQEPRVSLPGRKGSDNTQLNGREVPAPRGFARRPMTRARDRHRLAAT